MSERIPPELVTEILIRSQVDTLLRCRTVSKQWRIIIDDPDFIIQHMNHSTKTNTNKSIFFKEVTNGDSFDLDLDSLHRCGSIRFLDQPKELGNTYELVIGSSNGLLCSTSLTNGDYLIQNPSTRKYYSLPSFLPCDCLGKEGDGFGYDSVTGDYKIATIVLVELLGIFQSQIFIGNVRTKACSVIQLPYLVCIESDYMGVLLNGTLHWLVDTFYDDGRGARHVIMGLDLGTEEFQQVPHPEFRRNESDDIDMYIDVLGTWLCVFVHHFEAGTHVWAMKEYGVRDSWTKLFTIPCDVLCSNSGQIISSLGFSKTGLEVLLEVDCSGLVWYEIEGKKAVDITFQGFEEGALIRPVICLRSLVPLDASVVGSDEDEPKQSQNSKQQKKKKDDFSSMGFKLKL